MKLPEQVRQTLFAANGYRPSKEPNDAIIQAIVRDCANTCLQVGATTNECHEMPEYCEQAILSRYGLGPKL